MKNITEFIVNQDPPPQKKNVSFQKEATKKPSISLKKDLGRGGVFYQTIGLFGGMIDIEFDKTIFLRAR